MSDFGDLVEGIERKTNGNGAARLTREQQFEILASYNKPAPNIRWNQKDLDETVQHIFKHVDELRKNLIDATGRFVKSQIEPLQRRIDELERKQENFRYVGVHESGQQYAEGNFCTFQGSLWHANADTSATPGTDATWTLCCKRGKDGR